MHQFIITMSAVLAANLLTVGLIWGLWTISKADRGDDTAKRQIVIATGAMIMPFGFLVLGLIAYG